MGVNKLLSEDLPAALSTLTSTTLATAVNGAQQSLPPPVRDVVAHRFLGVSIWQYLAAFFFVLLGLVLRRLVIHVLERYRIMRRLPLLRLDEQLVRTLTQPVAFAVALLGILAAVKVLYLPEGLDQFATNLLISILIADLAWLLVNLADSLIAYIERFAERAERELDEHLMPILRKSLKIFIIVIAGVQVIQQMGGDVKALLTGLGLGGLAFALAARDSIANFFGSVVILADRPFRVGDWIEAQGQGIEGIVEDIGFRSTRIRTFSKSLITVPNSVVANWAINNWSAMPRRRVKLAPRIAPQTPPRQIEDALARIREVLRTHPMIDREDPPLAYLYDFSDMGLSVAVEYFTTTKEYAPYVAAREDVNLAILRIFEELGIRLVAATPSASPAA